MITATLAWGRGATVRRLMLALSGSLLLHLLVGWHGADRVPGRILEPQLQARLILLAAIESVDQRQRPAVMDGQQAPEALRPRPAGLIAEPQPAVLRSGDGVAASPDSRFYQARELDLYPVPQVPLTLRQFAHEFAHEFAHDIAGSVRLWVSIDYAGRVVDVAVDDADPPGVLETAARELVMATPFGPARKNGQPVNSRVLLALRFGP